MNNEWKVVPGYYPGFLEIVGASFKVSIVTTASDLSFEDFCNRTNDAHIMAAAKDMLNALEGMVSLFPTGVEDEGSGIGFNDNLKAKYRASIKAIAKARGQQ